MIASIGIMVGVAGFEPTTPCPPDKCANRAALHSDEALIEKGLGPRKPARPISLGARRAESHFALAESGQKLLEPLVFERTERLFATLLLDLLVRIAGAI